MADIIEIKSVDLPVVINENAIEHLESLLEDARTGRITEIGFAYVTSDNSIGYGFSDGVRCNSLVAAVANLQHVLLSER